MGVVLGQFRQRKGNKGYYADICMTQCINMLQLVLWPMRRICDLASENRPYDIFNPNGVIIIML